MLNSFTLESTYYGPDSPESLVRQSDSDIHVDVRDFVQLGFDVVRSMHVFMGNRESDYLLMMKEVMRIHAVNLGIDEAKIFNKYTVRSGSMRYKQVADSPPEANKEAQTSRIDKRSDDGKPARSQPHVRVRCRGSIRIKMKQVQASVGSNPLSSKEPDADLNRLLLCDML